MAAAGLFAAPFLYLAVRNAATPSAFLSSLSSAAALAPLGRSLLLAGTVAVAAAGLGTVGAWLTARTDVRGRGLLRVLLPLPLVIPSFIGAFALIAAFAPGGLVARVLGIDAMPRVRGFWAAFGVLTLLTFPYVHLPVAARLQQLAPSLEEAARLSGRGPGEVFRTVVLPQARAAILAGTLLVFLYVISDFGAVELLRYDTLTRVIFASVNRLDAVTALALSLQLGVLAVAVVSLERVLTGGPRRVEAA
ncbi:MAG TPA: ABC transporter permease subunit, partial [Nitriliruptorales bacterium]|nr:ABC transporter permease subunit [Nitriliruptorales bacterium]